MSLKVYRNKEIMDLDKDLARFEQVFLNPDVEKHWEVQPKIFTKFFRADNARLAEGEGSGLGLSIAKMIMEGKIWFESIDTLFSASFQNVLYCNHTHNQLEVFRFKDKQAIYERE